MGEGFAGPGAAIAAAVLILAGCSDSGGKPAVLARNIPPPMPTLPNEIRLTDGISKFCDEGRAVYVYSQAYRGGVAVVPDAPERVKFAASGEAVPPPNGSDQ